MTDSLGQLFKDAVNSQETKVSYKYNNIHFDTIAICYVIYDSERSVSVPLVGMKALYKLTRTKLDQIKLLRSLFGIGLKEAKDLCDIHDFVETVSKL
jgi:hypothetical protein